MTMTLTSVPTALLLLLSVTSSSHAFSTPLFTPIVTNQKTAPSTKIGVEIELPDFEALFDQIQQVSPLTKVAFEGGGKDGKRGFAAMEQDTSDLAWKVIETNKRKVVHHVDKIDNFSGLDPPLLRFRGSLEGPCVGEAFANFIMNFEERKKWDPAIADVVELYPIKDLDFANVVMGYGKYGDCSRLGVGYCRTKKYGPVPGREQLTLCGIQDMPDGSTVIWGTEMEDWHNHLLPEGERHQRAKSHLFSTTLVPTGENTFDVEYCLQINIGNVPNWLTQPILVETVKGMYRHAKDYFNGKGENSEVYKFLEEKSKGKHLMAERNSILMTP